MWREKAQNHQARIEGILAYKEARYQSAYQLLDRSLRSIPDARALYYRALALDETTALCRQREDNWDTYFIHCKSHSCAPKQLKRAQKHYREFKQACVGSDPCPVNAHLQDGACIVCQADRIWVETRGCMERESSSASITERPITEGRSQQRGFFSQVPWWTYLSLALGITAHIVNFTMDTPAVIDASFYTAIAGYSLGAIGTGVGIYRAATAPALSADDEQSSLRFLPLPPSPLYIQWGISF